MSWIRHTIICAVALAAMGISTGCEEIQHSDRNIYEWAEEALQRGDYDRAVMYYEMFIERHPSHPLVPFIEQRLNNIEREIESVMGRRSSPAPIYIRPTRTESDETRHP